MAAVQASRLTKIYRAKTTALDDIGFAVPAGTVFALLGPNGAGKSTTIKILTTLTRPTSGTASVGGFDVQQQPERVRAAIGCVAQRTGSDLFATGRENLRLQGELCGLRGRVLHARLDELLDRFDLTRMADRSVRTYSGGTQRRLDLAMAIVHNPPVLFLDEPTAGLDPEMRSALWQDIRELVRTRSTTVFLTTHYLEEADQLANRVAILDRGKLVREGTPEQLKGELACDVVRVELDSAVPAEAIRARLSAVANIHEVAVENTSVNARVDCAPTAVPAIVAALGGNGTRVMSVQVKCASLDDVYLRYASRAFAPAAAGAAEVA